MTDEWVDLTEVIRKLELPQPQPVVDGWDLRCHVCHGWLPSAPVVDQTHRLARHLVEVHPFYAALLAIALAAERARAYAGG